MTYYGGTDVPIDMKETITEAARTLLLKKKVKS